MKKELKYIGSYPAQSFPGKPGWEFLPKGYTGTHYGKVTAKFTQYFAIDRRPARKTEQEAIKDCISFAKESGISGPYAIQKENALWEIVTMG